MLFTIIDHIRSKPKHIRDQYALGIAVFCTLAVGGVWTLSLPSRFTSGSQVAALASSTNAAPFSNFFTQLKNQFTGIKETVIDSQASSSTALSAASSTEAALGLQLSDVNKDEINGVSTTDQGTKIRFGDGSTATTSDSYSTPVTIGTSSTSSPGSR